MINVNGLKVEFSINTCIEVSGYTNLLEGEFISLKYSRKNLEKYDPELAKMLDAVREALKIRLKKKALKEGE